MRDMDISIRIQVSTRFETSPQHVHRCTIPLRTLRKFSQLCSGGCRAFNSIAAAYSRVVLPRIPHCYAVQAVAILGSCRSFDTGIEFRGGNFCHRENHAICGARSKDATGSSLMVIVGEYHWSLQSIHCEMHISMPGIPFSKSRLLSQAQASLCHVPSSFSCGCDRWTLTRSSATALQRVERDSAPYIVLIGFSEFSAS